MGSTQFGRSVIILAILAAGLPIGAAAQPAPHDPTLPSVTPPALEKLSNDRLRQKIMLESMTPYAGRCVCPTQTLDSAGQSCKGRHETIRRGPKPLCRPAQVTPHMISAWRAGHP